LVCALAATALSLTYGLFHLAWLAVVLLALARSSSRRLKLATAVCLLLVASWYAKTWIRFGSFAPSTWFGMHLAATTHLGPGAPRVHALVDQGVLRPLSRVPPFRHLNEYPPELVVDGEGPPELWSRTKHHGGMNLNHFAYVRLSEEYAAEWRTVLRHAPGVYAERVATCLYTTGFRPSTDYGFVRPNRDRLAWYANLNDLLFGRMSWNERRAPNLPFWSKLRARLTVTPPLLPISILLGCFLAARRALAPRTPPSKAQRAWFRLACLSLAWVLLIPTLLNAGETNRIRVIVTPLLVVMVTLAIEALIERIRRQLAPRRPPTSRSVPTTAVGGSR
jgi:hypothetical protein